MGEIYRFSAPGRTEISGNHTDHQHGCVLAAAVNLETVAQVEIGTLFSPVGRGKESTVEAGIKEGHCLPHTGR